MKYVIVTNNERLVRQAKTNGDLVFVSDAPVKKGVMKNNTTSRVYGLLKDLAFKPNNKGYRYLKFLLEKIEKESTYCQKAIVSEIYPECAKEFNTTPSRAERCIRHALEISFEEAHEKYEELFGASIKRAPTNSEFLALVSEYFINN